MTEEFLSFDVFPEDLTSTASVGDLEKNKPAATSEQTAAPASAATQPVTEKEREQLQAYRRCFETLEQELSAIDERHKNDVEPEDSKATQELKAVRKELQDLKDAIAMQKQQQQQMPPQMQQIPQQPFTMQPTPQMMYSSPFGSGFSVPFFNTPNFQPTIPNMTNFKQ
jgi:hypothetical protein